MHNTKIKQIWHRRLIPLCTALMFIIFTIILQFPVQASSVKLAEGWILSGTNQGAEKYATVDPNVLSGKDTLKITYDLNGVCILDGDASAIIFDQPLGGSWRYASLFRYGKNCFDGVQSVNIPLRDFTGLITSSPVGQFHVRFWNSKAFNIEIQSVEVFSSETSSTTSPTPTVQNTPAPSPVQSTTGYRGEYYNNTSLSGSPSLVRTDNAVNFVWNQGSPAPTIVSNHFSARWIRSVNLASGNYIFTVSADDGVRLYVDGRLLIDKWVDQPMRTYIAKTTLSGGEHTVKMEYYEKTGGAIAKMAFAATDIAPTQAVAATPTPTRIPTAIVTPTAVVTISPTRIPTEPAATPSSSPIPTSTVTPTPTRTAPTPTSMPVPTSVPSTSGWQIKSVSSMKETKDKICGQDDINFINQWVSKAAELGVNYIAVETPYDNPSCADALSYTKKWVDAIRAKGLKVWHRHMPLAFEGIYSVPKNNGSTYLTMISDYIKNNPSLFAEGDIFTPIPEPQNGGISGITYCAENVCQFQSKEQFNKWLRDAMDTSESAFQTIGKGGKMKIGYYGFDGFVAWGANNPDWNGILEDATIAKMGNITIDHYPELINTRMSDDLKELNERYPNIPIIIGEWGSTNGSSDLQQQVTNSMGAAKNAPFVIGFNYWHMGMGGNESLINSDFTNRPQFATVQSYFK